MQARNVITVAITF